MPKERIAIYYDGFNLYHALCDLKANHLKWVNLWQLSELLISRRSQSLVSVVYFSSYAEHFKTTQFRAEPPKAHCLC